MSRSKTSRQAHVHTHFELNKKAGEGKVTADGLPNDISDALFFCFGVMALFEGVRSGFNNNLKPEHRLQSLDGIEEMCKAVIGHKKTVDGDTGEVMDAKGWGDGPVLS